MPSLPTLKDKTRFKLFPRQEKTRDPVMRSITKLDVAMPHADIKDTATLLAGVQKRFARKPPVAEPGILKRLEKFVDEFLNENLVPLAPDTDVSVPTWLQDTNYPLYRREELEEKETPISMIVKEHCKVKLFMKDETYPSFKHGRGINSRSDEFKTAVGPYFKLIEAKVFDLHWFIKHIPVADRPEYIKTLLYRSGSKYFASDYTTFEALFTGDLMKACEFRLYRYMTKYLVNGGAFCDLVEQVLGGTNTIRNRYFGVEIEATRMSGEMCTSLGNGFSNLMFMLFVCRECGCKDVDGVVEGDDGLFVFNGTAPTPSDFARLGLDIKLDIYDSLSEASFCGLIFDEKDLCNITDPIEVLRNFMWTNSRYIHASEKTLKILLRAKSLSYGWQYPGCPILASLAKFGLRVTEPYLKDGNVIHVDSYNYMKKTGAVNEYVREEFLSNVNSNSTSKIPFVDIPLNTRLLMEKKFGVTIDHQYRIEAYLDSLSTLQEYRIPFLDMYGHPDQITFADRYIRTEKLDALRPFHIPINVEETKKMFANCVVQKAHNRHKRTAFEGKPTPWEVRRSSQN